MDDSLLVKVIVIGFIALIAIGIGSALIEVYQSDFGAAAECICCCC